MTTLVWIEPSLQDYQAHVKAIISLPQVYGLASSESTASTVLSESNAPNLYLESIKRYQKDLLELLNQMNTPLISFKVSGAGHASKEYALQLTNSLLTLLDLDEQNQISTQGNSASLIVQAESKGSLISGLCVSSESGDYGFHLVISDSSRRVELNVPTPRNASPILLTTHDKFGSHTSRVNYESSARMYWSSKS